MEDPYDAIVLAGGSGRRLGGTDKATIEVGGVALLERALAAVSGAHEIVAVGARQNVAAHVRTTSENPLGGGPVAALEAGLSLVGCDVVVVLACDLPFVTRSWIERLTARAHQDTGDGVVPVDRRGRRQVLSAAYRATPLRAALAALPTVRDAAMRDLLSHLTLLEVATEAEASFDCDTWDDVSRARELMEDK